MNIDNFSGYIHYGNEEYIFIFEKYELKFIPNSFNNYLIYSANGIYESISDKKTGDFINDIILSGVCFDGKNVAFCIHDCRWIKNNISIYKVKWVYIYNSDINDIKIKGVDFLSQEINYFYDTKKYIKDDYEIEDGYFKNYTINIKSLKKTLLGSFEYNSHKYKVYGDMAWKKHYDVSNNLEVWSKLSIESSRNIVNLEEVYGLTLLQKSVIDIITYRTNNTFDSIETYTRNKNKRKHILGRFYISEECNKEVDYKQIKHLITCNNIENIGILYELVDNNKINRDYFCDSIKSKLIYNSSRILGILIAFERIINWKFDKNNMRNDQYLQLLERMEELITDNKDELCKGLSKTQIKFNKTTKSIFQPKISFATLIINAIEEYPITKTLITGIYQTKATKKLISEIAERINKLRNSMAHGKLDIEFDENNVKDMRFLEYFLYIMILSEMNLSDDVIVDKIICLFNIKYLDFR